MKRPENVDEYIAGFPADTQKLLEQIRQTIIANAPQAQEVISYAMPGYKLNGMLVWFAGFASHIGFYPGASGIAAYSNQLSAYKWAKGSVQFPINEPLPIDLIASIVNFKVAELTQKLIIKKQKLN